ncbi:hypothetical protein [Streptomyces brasiliensis]|uniref:Mandelate racemase/muconate lactonizing enzyme N-terminal domain-containing protein n=1 Tax=Streptomyces brasiliensis TaxID=1954 RepID=A0A917NKA9_9ACTN|nr:hypothetical protein GCM10010121_016630 [Streptomyces brasiliensis]
MKIVRVEAIPFAIPYAKPLRFASGEVHTADHVLVRVHTDEGLTGIAEAGPVLTRTARPRSRSSR